MFCSEGAQVFSCCDVSLKPRSHVTLSRVYRWIQKCQYFLFNNFLDARREVFNMLSFQHCDNLYHR